MSKKMNGRDELAMRKLYHLGEVIAKERPDVPPTRDELGSLGVTKQDLKNLERLGLVKSRTMIVNQTYKNGNKATLGRVVYVFTTLGREVCNQLGFQPLVDKAEEPGPVILPESPVVQEPQEKAIIFDSIT